MALNSTDHATIKDLKSALIFLQWKNEINNKFNDFIELKKPFLLSLNELKIYNGGVTNEEINDILKDDPDIRNSIEFKISKLDEAYE